jgi:hypothetical protein
MDVKLRTPYLQYNDLVELNELHGILNMSSDQLSEAMLVGASNVAGRHIHSLNFTNYKVSDTHTETSFFYKRYC